MECKICGSHKVFALSDGNKVLGRAEHKICYCGSHLYEGNWYTKKEWETWINNEDIQEYETKMERLI